MAINGFKKQISLLFLNLIYSDHKYDNFLILQHNFDQYKFCIFDQMPKKQHHSPKQVVTQGANTPQQFLIKFIEKNFERKQIEQQAFVNFNKLAMMLGKQLSKLTTLTDVEGFVMMVKTIFRNFQDLNKNRLTFSLYIQLLEICLQIFERSVSLGLSKQICCELLRVLSPIYQSTPKDEQFAKMEQKFGKINMPKQFTEPETMTKIGEYQTVPALIASSKYEKLINCVFKEIENVNKVRSILKAYINIEGQNYLDSILQILMKCLEEVDTQNFKRIFNIYLCIGDSTTDLNKNMAILMTKILSSREKVQFLHLVFHNSRLEKIYEPNHLFYVCVNALDLILSEKSQNSKMLDIIRIVAKYMPIFNQITKIPEEQKLLNLYNKILSFLLLGRKYSHAKKIKSNQLVLEKEKEEEAKNLSFIQISNSAEMQQEPPIKQVQSKKVIIEILNQKQINLFSVQFRNILTAFTKNKKIYQILKKMYLESEPRTQQFLKICKEAVNAIPPQCLRLIIGLYIPLISQNNSISLLSDISKQQSSLMKIIKLRILEQKIRNEKLVDQQIFQKYYKPYHAKLVCQDGLNFDFLALTILQEYIESPEIIIEYLMSSCLQKIQEKSEKKDLYFRCNISLIASLLDQHHNIVIKLSYNKIKSQINNLNNKFSVQDFLCVNEVKQNMLFLSGARIQMRDGKQGELELIRKFITQLFKTQKLEKLINLKSSQQNSYFYMILIELCTVCMQKNPEIKIECEEIQTIIKLRKNNRYSLRITLANQIINMFKDCLGNGMGQLEASIDQQTIILHLLLKLQTIMIDLPNPNSQNKQIEAQKGVINELSAEKLQKMVSELIIFIRKLGSDPKFEVLKIINNSIESEKQILNMSISETDSKKHKLKESIKNFHIIKFYSEAISNKQILTIMLIKTALKILDQIFSLDPKYLKQQYKDLLKQLKILYDNKTTTINQSEKKAIQTYIKLRLLTMSAVGEKTHLSPEQIKKITKVLEENHDEVSKLITEEEENQTPVGLGQIFRSKSNFIGFLLEQITKSEHENNNEREISLLNLNVLKTLIDNNLSVLQIAKRYTFEKLENTQIIPTLVMNRTRKSIDFLKNLYEKSVSKNEGVEGSEKRKIREFEKEEEKILEESKKIYQILAKMLASSNNLKSEKEQSILNVISEILKLQDHSNIFVSVYLVREVINIFPILKCTLGTDSFKNLTENIFTHLMSLKQMYEGYVIEYKLDKNKAQSQLNIYTIINFFIQNLYSESLSQNYAVSLNDATVIINSQKQLNLQKKISNVQKDKKSQLNCLGPQKKGSFKCLKCDILRQICLNCVIVCHKNHPIVSVQPGSRNSKNCQCSEENCKINPIFDKKKESTWKRRSKANQSYRRGEMPRAYVEQIRQRNPTIDYIGGLMEDQYQEQQSFNSMFGNPSALIRAGNQGMIHAVYSGRQSSLGAVPVFPPQGRTTISSIPLMNPPNNLNNLQPLQPYTSMQPPAIQNYNNPNIFPPNVFGQQLIEPSSNNPNLMGRAPTNMPMPMGGFGGLGSGMGGLGGGLGRGGSMYRMNINRYELSQDENEFENQLQIRQQRQRERDRRQKQILREKQKQRQRQRQRQRQQIRQFINQSRYGQIHDRYSERVVNQIPQYTDNMEDQDPSKDKFEDEDYEKTQHWIENKKKQLKQEEVSKNENLYQITHEQSYFLPCFTSMVLQLLENKPDSSKDKQPEINWQIKLANPITLSTSLVNTSAKMCPPRSFITKFSKNEANFSPCISRAPIAVSQKFVFILSGPKITIHLKQQLYSYILDKNGSSIVYQFINEQHLQFEPHSVCVGFKNYLCVAGLRQINMFEYDNSGQIINRNSPLRHNINNDNINKLRLTRYGVFISLNRQIRLLTHMFMSKISFKLPDALIKQWSIVENTPDSFSLYVTCSEGYIFVAEANINSSSEVNLTKKLNDLRTNRPVGSFVLAKKVEGCGTLVLSTYKDKNIGHSLGRLSGELTMTDINYIKLYNQGLDPIYDKYNIVGLSDIIVNNVEEKQKTSKQIYIVTLYKQQKNDVMSVHRGILGFIRIRQDPNTGISKYESQMITGDEEKCEYFEILWFEDKKNWIVLSLCQDGGLRLTMPNKIPRATIQKQLTILKQKKVGMDKLQNPQKQKGQDQQANKNEQNETYEKLSNSIKEHINVKSIKDNLQERGMESNQFLAFIQNAQLLKLKDDYTITTLSSNSQTKTKLYQLKLTNRKKIITGLCLADCSDIILPTRKIKGVFEVGFTNEQSLYFYAFGVIKIEVKKVDDSVFSRDVKKMSSIPGRNRDSQYSSQQRMFLGMSSNLKVGNQISAYGEMLENNFKPKVSDLIKKIEKYMNANNPFDLSQQERIEICLKNCNLLLTNSILENNLTISKQEAEDFVKQLRSKLVLDKKKQATCNRLYTWVKKVIYKSLRLQQIFTESELHPFNHEYHPLKYATETKIKFLYESLTKGEITDLDYISLVNELYGFACGIGEEEVGAVNEKPEINLLLYYIALYPSMLSKINKKIKVLETNKILHRVIPLYIFGYVTLKYLGYNLEWIIPALCEVVGKSIISNQDSLTLKPSTLNRYILFKYLKKGESIKLEPWLKNIEGIDKEECLKQDQIKSKKPTGNKNSNIDYTKILFDGEDEEALIRKLCQLTQLQVQNEVDPIDQQMNREEENEMQEQGNAEQLKGLNPFIKDIIQESLKQIDYTLTNVENNCLKATILFVIFKLSLSDLKESSDNNNIFTFDFLCTSIRNVISKLCQSYHQFSNPSTHCILMMWLNLFGMVFKKCTASLNSTECYQRVKQSIMGVLGKFKIENVKKLNHVPNLFARRIKGSKVNTKADFIYGFISVLQKPCEANFVLLTLGCYWLFPHDESYYNKKKYVDTIRQNQKSGNMNKIYQTAISNLEIWREIGNPQWLEDWIQQQKEDWPQAMQLLALYYE